MNVFASILPLFLLAPLSGSSGAAEPVSSESAQPAAETAEATVQETPQAPPADGPAEAVLPNAQAGSEESASALPANDDVQSADAAPAPAPEANEETSVSPAAAVAAPSEAQPADAPANMNAPAAAAADSPNAITGWDRVSGAYAPPPASGSRGGSARSSRESEPKSLLDAPFAPHGPFISVGFSLHRYTMKTLSMEQDNSSRRAFDGGALSVQAGYLARRGGFIGLDWAHHTGRNSLRTAGGESSLELNSDFVSLMTGLQVGSRVRAHLAVLVGVAHGEFMRSIRVEHADAETGEIQEQRDSKKTSASAFLLGADLGLIVMPTEWLAIGLHFRADRPFFNDALNGTAGIYAGLSATFVYPL